MQRSATNAINQSQASLGANNKSRSKLKAAASGDVGTSSKIAVKPSKAENVNEEGMQIATLPLLAIKTIVV